MRRNLFFHGPGIPGWAYSIVLEMRLRTADRAAVERTMKVQEIVMRAMSKQIHMVAGGGDPWREHADDATDETGMAEGGL